MGLIPPTLYESLDLGLGGEILEVSKLFAPKDGDTLDVGVFLPPLPLLFGVNGLNLVDGRSISN